MELHLFTLGMRNRKLFTRYLLLTSSASRSLYRLLLLLLAVTSIAIASPDGPPPAVESALPDSPGVVFSTSQDLTAHGSATRETSTVSTRPSPHAYTKVIGVGQTAPPQRTSDKVVLGLRESVTPLAMLGWLYSAEWSHLIDGSPNYGTNGKAFAQRLGAAAVLGSSKEIFSDAVLAPVFHQDPRYYQLGRSHRFINRAAYAASRAVISRTDSGSTVPNYAFMLGTAGADALTFAYYPERNRTGSRFAQTWLTSVGGTAFGYIVSEFSDDLKQWAHLQKRE